MPVIQDHFAFGLGIITPNLCGLAIQCQTGSLSHTGGMVPGGLLIQAADPGYACPVAGAATTAS